LVPKVSSLKAHEQWGEKKTYTLFLQDRRESEVWREKSYLWVWIKVEARGTLYSTYKNIYLWTRNEALWNSKFSSFWRKNLWYLYDLRKSGHLSLSARDGDDRNCSPLRFALPS
jgi:hypothetical protein